MPNTLNYMKQGGDTLVIGGAIVGAAESQAANVAEIVVTYTSNDPTITPDAAITVANGTTPTVAELLEFCEELKANQNAIIAALEGIGILADS